MATGRLRRVMNLGLSTMVNSISVLLLQVLALVALIPADFGRFSAVYLMFGFATSFLLSIVCEAWQRKKPHSGWEDYGSALFWLSFVAGLIGGSVCLVVESLRPLTLPATIALVCAVYRTGARYHAVQQGHNRYVLVGDLGSLVVLAGAWAVIFLGAVDDSRLVSVAWAWALSSAVAALVSKWPTSIRFSALRSWMKKHGHEIRTLLADSMILDASGIGVPYILIPILSISGFGTYRALSNFSGPVKLILFPLRPLFSARSIQWFARAKVVGLVTLAAAFIGAVGGAALNALQRTSLELGTLRSLSEFWPVAAVFVAATFLNGVYYLIGRTHFDRRTLLSGRIAATCVGIVLPVSGALMGGLDGALLGTTLFTAVVAVMWMLLTMRTARRANAGEAVLAVS